MVCLWVHTFKYKRECAEGSTLLVYNALYIAGIRINQTNAITATQNLLDYSTRDDGFISKRLQEASTGARVRGFAKRHAQVG